MSAAQRFTIVWVSASLAFLIFVAWLHMNGFFSESSLRLWSKAILQVEGPASYKTSDAVYPPVPLVLAILLQHVTGSDGVAVPQMISACLAGFLAASWFFTLTRAAGFSASISFVLVALAATNPLFVLAVSEGPEMSLLCIGVWIFGQALISLRLYGGTPAMMKVAVGLMIAGLSSSYGLLIAFGALPFLAVAARPSMLVAAPVGYTVVMGFPVACAVGSLLFVSSIFNTPLVSEVQEFTARPDNHLALPAFLAMSVPACVVALLMRRHFGYVLALLSSFLTVASAMVLNQTFNFLGGALMTTAPIVGLGMVALQYWPRIDGRCSAGVLVMMFCWIAAAILVSGTSNQNVKHWRDAAMGHRSTQSEEVARVAEFLWSRNDILLDAERNPDLVVALGSVEKFVLAGSTDYEITLLGGAPVQSIIVVRNAANGQIVRDRILRRFPEMGQNRLAGYKKALHAGQWMVWERMRS